MSRAADPKKIKDLTSAVKAIKRKAKNVALNLDTGAVEVSNAQGAVIKTFSPEKGIDAAYVINYSEVDADVKSSGELLKQQRTNTARKVADAEVAFAETQDDLMRNVIAWQGAEPGTGKAELAVEIGRLQLQLSILERRLRDTQYGFRETQDFPASRRLYEPLSFDDRKPVFGLAHNLIQKANGAADRVVPVRTTGKP